MLALTPAERRDLKAKAHRLHPVVSVGHHGLTPAVLHEIDVNLLAHELIKVRVFEDDRHARETLLARICAELDAAPVQHIGKLLVVWRPAPPAVESAAEPAIARPAADRASEKRSARPPARRRQREARSRRPSAEPIVAAKTTPQARRPRTPLPRALARPPAGTTRGTQQRAPATGGRRRRRVP
jgi:putative YhbY family RNA-binding protein